MDVHALGPDRDTASRTKKGGKKRLLAVNKEQIK